MEIITENEAEFILYEWTEGISYANLTTEEIRQSTRKADIMNYNKKNLCMEENEKIENILNINTELTEDDVELIDEFLNV